MERERRGFVGSIKASMKASGAELFGGDFWGIPLGFGVGLWWWIRGTPVAPSEDAADDE